MIRQLHLKNFKCFENANFSFSKINFIAGENAVGKSSLLQSLLFIQQAVFGEFYHAGSVPFNGPLVNLGLISDVLYSAREKDELALHLQASPDNFVKLDFNFNSEGRSARILHLNDAQKHIFTNQLSEIFSDDFNYLGADRFGPRNLQTIDHHLDETLTFVGKHGELWERILAIKGNEIASREISLSNWKAESPPVLRELWNEWMSYIFPGFEGKVEYHPTLDVTASSFSTQKDGKGQSIMRRPVNTGFGLYYAAPIILAGLLTSSNGIFFLENPEAHLHPAAQSRMGEFLALLSRNGPQCFIETHSDHLINGARKAIVKNLVRKEDIRVIFIAKKCDNIGSEPHVINPSNSGGFDVWPRGFMDQADLDTSIIYS